MKEEYKKVTIWKGIYIYEFDNYWRIWVPRLRFSSGRIKSIENLKKICEFYAER